MKEWNEITAPKIETRQLISASVNIGVPKIETVHFNPKEYCITSIDLEKGEIHLKRKDE